MVKFKDTLDKRPLIFTALPLRDNRTGDPVHDEKILKNLDQRIKELSGVLKDFSRINAISVPELVEENHEGKPRFNSVYTRALSRKTADNLGIDAIINKVVAHIENYQKFVEWIDETISLGINNMIFVGGNTRHHRYPGPSVSEANIIASRFSKQFLQKEITIGNISLPERREEHKGMLFKTLSGSKFFTTQLLFDSEQISTVIKEYNSQCNIARTNPATIILSFAPIRSVADLNLLDFLGVDMPDKAKNYILETNDLNESSHRSVINALNIYKNVMKFLSEENIKVNTGINVEQLTKSNLLHTKEMLYHFERIVDLDYPDIEDYIDRLNRNIR